MKILCTNLSLSSQSGSETFLRGTTTTLQSRGHRVAIYSPILGPFAEKVREEGIEVFDNLDAIPFHPDIIHGQHHVETMSALLNFPGVPAVYFCHDRRSWHDRPPDFQRIRRFIAVDEACANRLQNDGIDPGRIRRIYNSVDLKKFVSHHNLPAVPRRAALINHRASEDNFVPIVREACERLNLSLDVFGLSCGNVTENPEQILPGYDLVFAKARCALEAMAAGCAVILIDPEASGPMVTADRWDNLRRLNFGHEACKAPLDVKNLIRAAGEYDPRDAALVREKTLSAAHLDGMVDQIEAVYEESLTEGGSDPNDIETCQNEAKAVSRYLRHQFDYQWLTEASRNEADIRQLKASLQFAHEEWGKLGREYSRLSREYNRLKSALGPVSRARSFVKGLSRKE